MKRLILFFLLSFSLFSAGKYNSYYSLNIGSSSISRDYSVEMTNKGSFFNKETGVKISGEKGETYSFNEKLSHTRLDFIYGFQSGSFGSFYEAGFYTGSVLDELFISYGMTFPDITFSQRWLTPYLKTSLGFGYTGAKFPQPSSFSYSYGIGFLSSPADSLKMRIGLDKIKRSWSDISHSYGNEKWEEDETNIYFGGMYFY